MRACYVRSGNARGSEKIRADDLTAPPRKQRQALMRHACTAFHVIPDAAQ